MAIAYNKYYFKNESFRFDKTRAVSVLSNFNLNEKSHELMQRQKIKINPVWAKKMQVE